MVSPRATSSLGRTHENQIALAGKAVSRRHAVIELTDAGWFIRDLGSTHGTFVNGEQVHDSPRRLSGGDTIRLGEMFLIFKEGG